MTIGNNERIPRGHFDGQSNITGDRPENLEPILNGMFDNISLQGATREDIDIYVSTEGHDEAGDGSEVNPYKTVKRALQDVPFIVRHTVHIRIQKGEYDDFPAVVERAYEDIGQLLFEGVGDDTVIDGTFTATAIESNWQRGYETITVAGAGWTPDEFRGYFVSYKSTYRAGQYSTIYKNTEDTIILVKNSIGSSPLENGVNFDIIEPPVSITKTGGGISFSRVGQTQLVDDLNALVPFFYYSDDPARVALGGLVINVVPMISQGTAIEFRNVNATMSCVRLNPGGRGVLFSDSNINVDPIVNRGDGFDNAIYGFVVSFLIAGDGDAGWDTYITGNCRINSMANRNGVFIIDGFVNLQLNCLLKLSTWLGIHYLGGLYIDALDLYSADSPGLILGNAYNTIVEMFIEKSLGDNGIRLNNPGGATVIDGLHGNSAGIPGSVLELKRGTSAYLKQLPTLTGTVNDYSQEGVSSGSWPASLTPSQDGFGGTLGPLY